VRSHSDRVKDFKRSQKSFGNCRIDSRNQEISVYKDAHLFYSSLFQVSPEHPQRDSLPLNNMKNHETLKLLSEVNEYYSDVKIKHWIINYASTKTCG
jgi:hypothetical protein